MWDANSTYYYFKKFQSKIIYRSCPVEDGWLVVGWLVGLHLTPTRNMEEGDQSKTSLKAEEIASLLIVGRGWRGTQSKDCDKPTIQSHNFMINYSILE
jgi:hypothetical protein